MVTGTGAGTGAASTKPLLLGESNPYGSHPDYALFPAPRGCAGWRLAALVCHLEADAYLDAFERQNLCTGAWRILAARERALALAHEAYRDRRLLVLLGAKVAGAFGLAFAPFTMHGSFAGAGVGGPAPRFVLLPHPSGRCRLWHEPDAFGRARSALRAAMILHGLAVPEAMKLVPDPSERGAA